MAKEKSLLRNAEYGSCQKFMSRSVISQKEIQCHPFVKNKAAKAKKRFWPCRGWIGYFIEIQSVAHLQESVERDHCLFFEEKREI